MYLNHFFGLKALFGQKMAFLRTKYSKNRRLTYYLHIRTQELEKEYDFIWFFSQSLSVNPQSNP